MSDLEVTRISPSDYFSTKAGDEAATPVVVQAPAQAGNKVDQTAVLAIVAITAIVALIIFVLALTRRR